MTGVSVRLFGQIKRELKEDVLFVETSESTTVRAFKTQVESALRARGLSYSLESVAIGTEEKILSDTEIIPLGGEVALLPPVCGG